jgi:putative membrane protein
MILKKSILWLFFLLTIISSFFLNLHGDLFQVGNLEINKSNFIILVVPVLLLLLHSSWTLGVRRSLFFVITASLIGFVFEYFGLKYGTIFGGEYVYLSKGIVLFSVPLNVVVFWSVFIYTGYCITNSFCYWLGREKPSIKNSQLKLLFFFILVDGLIVVLIDLFMDPLQVYSGTWSWPNGGPVFGVPIGNFVGWFVVTVLSSGVFRVFEYYYPKQVEISMRDVFIIPVLGYGLLYLNFLSASVKFEMFELSFVGSLTMLPIFVSNIILYSLRNNRHKNHTTRV